MHDPDVVALEIRRPWPERSTWPVSPDSPRWSIRRGAFWTLAGRRYYFPSLVTIWHREPGGHDSGEVCKHFHRRQGKYRVNHTWKAHVHHWRIQVTPLQELRRRLLTRCAWCGGRSTNGDAVNCAAGWYTPDRRWFEGESDLFHGGCQSVYAAHHVCTCNAPRPASDSVGSGTCDQCMLAIPWRPKLYQQEQRRLLKRVRFGDRPGQKIRDEVAALYERSTVEA